MAHTCPDCDEVCYCQGDTDDIVFGSGDDEAGCTHPCAPCDCDDCIYEALEAEE